MSLTTRQRFGFIFLKTVIIQMKKPLTFTDMKGKNSAINVVMVCSLQIKCRIGQKMSVHLLSFFTRITGYSELDGTHEDQDQLVTPHRET